MPSLSPKYCLALLAALLVAALAASCANPGSGPDGGPYDETPPRVIATSPALGATGQQTRRVTITFDEPVNVERAAEKVTVSPPQLEQPEIKTSGRRISVVFQDTLQAATTYTIDFSDAIVDATEGNPLGHFTHFFSTGDDVDTMEVAGTVLAAENLEPIKGILVGLYADSTDSAFRTRPFDRVARTDSRGRFTVKGVRAGTYSVVALRDMDGDFRYSPGEMLAQLRERITTSARPDIRRDTIWHDSIHYDSIRTVRYTHYFPDNLILTAYSPSSQPRHFLKAQRQEPESFTLFFTGPSEKRPVVRGLNFDDALLFPQINATNDTAVFWLRSLDFPTVDSLEIAFTYEDFNDSLGLVDSTETRVLVPRNTMARRLKLRAEEQAKFEKAREKRHRRGDYSLEELPPTMLALKARSTAGLTPMQNPTLTFEEPVVGIDETRFHLFLREDSTETEAPFEILTDSGAVLSLSVLAEWRPSQRYRLEVDSAALCGLTGHVNRATRIELSFAALDDFGALFVHLVGAEPCAVVQLLASDTKVERQVPAENDRADFFYLRPGTYYLRLFYDRNHNGRWDTGDPERGLEPEPVRYFPQKLDVRANWDISQDWNVDALPLNRQKPEELIKQKADAEKKTAAGKNAERERNRK